MYNLQQLSDREEIRDLRIRYSHYYDSQDLEKLCGLFAQDAVCVLDEAHGGNWVGLAAIRENFSYWFSRYPGSFTVVHAVTNHHIEFTGENTARGRCFLLDYNFTYPERATPLGTVGVYDDDYIRTETGWKFQRMSLDLLWPKRMILNEPF